MAPAAAVKRFDPRLVSSWGYAGRWRRWAQIGWIGLAALSLILFLAGVPARYGLLLVAAGRSEQVLRDLDLAAGTYASYFTALDLVLVLTHFAIAGLIAWRRSDSPMALLVATTLVTTPLAVVGALEPGSVLGRWLGSALLYLGLIASLGLLYLFPDGRFVPGWARPLALIWALLNVPAVFFPTSTLSVAAWPVPFRVLILLAWSLSGVYAQMVRFWRVSSPAERQQTKWAGLGLTAAMLAPFGTYLNFLTLPSLSQASPPTIFYHLADPNLFRFALVTEIVGLTIYAFGLLIFPASFALAILRYHLFGIELIVNRTLVYGTLTAALAVIYAGSIVLFQELFRIVTSQNSPLAVAVSTLGLAALFRPLRRRIQDVIDRRLYRRKYDAARTLAAFGATCRDEVALDQLVAELLRVVDETMQPAHVALWLKSGPGSATRYCLPGTCYRHESRSLP